MLRKRLITILTFNNGVLFRTKNFIPDYRYTLNFVDSWLVDEVIILDITRGIKKNSEKFYEIVQKFAKDCFVPLTVGGLVSSETDFSKLLHCGADKIVINTKALEQPNFITSVAKKYGSQCVVVSIDAKKVKSDKYEVFSKHGTCATGLDPVKWAKETQNFGAGEIMLTSIDKDGSLEGYDNNLNSLVSEAIDIPLLVSGGAGKWQDFVDGITIGKAAGVCTTNIYHFTKSSIASAKKFMYSKGLNIRI
tara:strand:- start:671 stop:1417 length:747 start_codon:yes stop_codon:yes gene_type:complete